MAQTAPIHAVKERREMRVSAPVDLTANSQILIQITDTHLMAQADSAFLHMNPEYSFHAIMDDIQHHYPHLDMLIHTGDLAQEAQPSTYQRYLQYMQNLQINFTQIPGNHDDLGYFPFQQPLPKPTVIDLDPWLIILLNSAIQGQVDGRIEHAQLLELGEILEQHQDKFILIACHHHPLDMQSQWIDQHKLKNTSDLLHVLKPYSNIKAVLCGHVHQDSLHHWNNIKFLSTPSTCVQFKPHQENFTLDDQAPGYRCLHLNQNGTFSTKIHRIQQLKPLLDEEILGY